MNLQKATPRKSFVRHKNRVTEVERKEEEHKPAHLPHQAHQMRLTTLPTTLLLLLPFLASAADDASTASQTQTSTSTLTITRTLYTITATATSVLALTVQNDGTTLVTYPDIQKPTGTDALGDIVLATSLSSGIGSSSAAATSFPKGTGTGVVAPSKTATGTPIATFTGAATRGGPHVVGLAVAIGLAAGFIA